MGQAGGLASGNVSTAESRGSGSESFPAPKTDGKDGKIWLRVHENGVLLQKRVRWFAEMAMLGRRALSCRIHRQQELSTVTMYIAVLGARIGWVKTTLHRT